MASRSIWRGALALGGPITLYIEAVKATDKYAGAEPLRQVCSDHMQPFTRRDICSVSGAKRLTEEVLKAGEPGERAVMAAEKSPGEYVEVDAATLKAIEESISSDMIEPLALIAREELPYQSIADLWYLRPNAKVAGAGAAVGMFYALLDRRGQALIGRWSTRGKQAIVAITANGALCMNRLRYAQETRQPDEDTLVPARTTVEDKALELLDQIIDLPRDFNLTETEDASVGKKAEAVQAALAGTLTPTPTAAPAPAAVVPDLMAQLEAAAGEKAKPKKAPAKAKVTA